MMRKHLCRVQLRANLLQSRDKDAMVWSICGGISFDTNLGIPKPLHIQSYPLPCQGMDPMTCQQYACENTKIYWTELLNNNKNFAPCDVSFLFIFIAWIHAGHVLIDSQPVSVCLHKTLHQCNEQGFRTCGEVMDWQVMEAFEPHRTVICMQ